jgi:hypothetical protein
VASICYVPKKFGDDALQTIAVANSICADYQQQGYDLTLRQLYYVFVSRDIIPNTIQSYKRLGDIINDARMAGLLDWDYIVDRTRNVRGLTHHTDPAHRIRTAASQYYIDMWANQDVRVEVWIEKDALAGVVQRACNANDVDYFSCRGYTSQSELWAAGQRLGEYMRGGQEVVVLHLGDHDPSGLDMTRDIIDRLTLFTKHDGEEYLRAMLNKHVRSKGVAAWGLLSHEEQEEGKRKAVAARRVWGKLDVRRIALNMDQIERYAPPPNPAKITDSRAKKYIERWGRSSWELDALEPTILNDLIQANIRAQRDDALWQEREDEEREGRRMLETVSSRWSDVTTFIEETG